MASASESTFFPTPAISLGTRVASQAITITTSAGSPTAYDTGVVKTVCFDIQSQPVRVRWDGTDPTDSVGHILPATTTYQWGVNQFNAARFIRDSAATGNATIFASPLA